MQCLCTLVSDVFNWGIRYTWRWALPPEASCMVTVTLVVWIFRLTMNVSLFFVFKLKLSINLSMCLCFIANIKAKKRRTNSWKKLTKQVKASTYLLQLKIDSKKYFIFVEWLLLFFHSVSHTISFRFIPNREMSHLADIVFC